MTESPAKSARGVFRTITPYLTVQDVEGLVTFIRKAFDAEGAISGVGSKGGFHGEFKIGDSMLMVGGGGQWQGSTQPVSLHLYVQNADAVYGRALEAGGTSVEKPVDQSYGDREAGVKDPAGNIWYIATNKTTGLAREGFHSITPFMHVHGAANVIQFLEKAFGASAGDRVTGADGTIRYAAIKIGDSALELSEAHGKLQPRPATFMLYVDDVDAWYARAMRNGAKSLSEPANQEYGDRVGGVTDPFGNSWYIGTHLGAIAQ